MVTNSDPLTGPANDTTPSAGATTGVPNGTPMSIPRCPAENGVGGGSNPRSTGPSTGQSHDPTGGEVTARAPCTPALQQTEATKTTTIALLLGATRTLPAPGGLPSPTLPGPPREVCDRDHTSARTFRSRASP